MASTLNPPFLCCRLLYDINKLTDSMRFVRGDPILRIDFTTEEVQTWGVVFRELHKLYPSHACKEHLKNLPLLTKYCNYSEDNIPQLEDISHFLKGNCSEHARHLSCHHAR